MSDKTMELEKREEMAPERVERTRRLRIPRVDIRNGDDVVAIVINMPGVSEENVDITLEKKNLTVIGRVADYSPEGFKQVYSESHGDGFKRSFILSNEIDRDNIQATLTNGVLRLTLHKAEEAKSRKISVQAS